MSLNVNYFFNYQDDLAAVAKLINTEIGCHLLPYQGDPRDFFSLFLGMELSLGERDFENDGALNFEDYAFHLSLRTAAGASKLRPIQIPAMVSIAYVLCVDTGITGMLVLDGQILLARYEERIESTSQHSYVYDKVSERLVRFPEHYHALERVIPEGWSYGELSSIDP